MQMISLERLTECLLKKRKYHYKNLRNRRKRCISKLNVTKILIPTSDDANLIK